MSSLPSITKANLIWVTPQATDLLVYMARVSNPSSQAAGATPEKLISYLIRNKHWSPFEMVSMCIELVTTRDIARQFMRHWSFEPPFVQDEVFHIQEFSQRYSATDQLPEPRPREARLQHPTNRQSSISEVPDDLRDWWHEAQAVHLSSVDALYKEALERGIAKEVARAVLPEGLTPTRMYVAATFRTWIHWSSARRKLDTQKEHRDLAQLCWEVMDLTAPEITKGVKTAEYADAYLMDKKTI